MGSWQLNRAFVGVWLPRFSPVFASALPVYESLFARSEALEIGILALADLLGSLRELARERGNKRERERGVCAAALGIAPNEPTRLGEVI